MNGWINLFIYSVTIIDTYSAQDTVKGNGDSAVNKLKIMSCLHGVHIPVTATMSSPSLLLVWKKFRVSSFHSCSFSCLHECWWVECL